MTTEELEEEVFGNCPRCNGVLVKRINHATNKEFLACSNFFNNGCKYTCNIDDKFILMKKFIEKELGIDIRKIISTWNESSNLCYNILEKNVSEEENDYIDFRLNIDSLSHNKDRRSSSEYAFSLLLGWLIEDAIIMYLGFFKYNIVLNGGDKNREFLSKLTVDADFKININGKKFFIEQITDFRGIWFKNKTIALRDNKYNFLLKENIYLFGIDLKNNYFILLNVIGRNADYIKHFEPYGGKPVHLLEIYEEDFYPLTELKNIDKILGG